VSEQENEARRAEDQQEAELVRLAAYAGLRQGELLALRWRDVDFAGSAITVARAISAGVETSTKSGRVRRVPLPDQAAAALDRLSRRRDFTGPDELVFCNALGRSLDSSALRRRFKRARDAAGLRPLRFHDLRHTYGSLLAAAGVDLVTIQAAMGHGALVTTGRYLHARPAADQAAVFTRAFQIAASVDELVTAEKSPDDLQA
jgi:integrase